MKTQDLDFRTWLHKQRNRRDVHGRDLYVVRVARHVARNTERYAGSWSTAEELCELMGDRPNISTLRCLAIAAEEYQGQHPVPVPARDLSCQGLQNVDPSTEPPTFHGRPVGGYEAEMARRGEGHVYGCELVGHMANDAPNTTNAA